MEVLKWSLIWKKWWVKATILTIRSQWSADRLMNVIGQHNVQLINQLIISWIWLVNVIISWSISWLVESVWLVSWSISWLVKWTWLVSRSDLPKFSRTCPNLSEFARTCFWAAASIGEDVLWFRKDNLLSFIYWKILISQPIKWERN